MSTPPPDDDVSWIAERIENKTYNTLYENITQESVKTSCLATATYETDFIRQTTTDNNYSYIDPVNKKTYQTIIFGEIASATHGTCMTAKGNYFTKVDTVR